MRPVLALLGFQFLSWSGHRQRRILSAEFLATIVLIATTSVIVHVVDSWEHFRVLIWVWLGTSLFVALASITGVVTGYESQAQFEMAQGAREGGFGQHPNWFANEPLLYRACRLPSRLPRTRALRWLAFMAGF